MPNGLGSILVLERILGGGATTISDVLMLVRILKRLFEKLCNLGTPRMWSSSDAVLLVDISLLVFLFP